MLESVQKLSFLYFYETDIWDYPEIICISLFNFNTRCIRNTAGVLFVSMASAQNRSFMGEIEPLSCKFAIFPLIELTLSSRELRNV